MEPQYHQSCLNESMSVFLLKICIQPLCFSPHLTLSSFQSDISESISTPAALLFQSGFFCFFGHVSFSLSVFSLYQKPINHQFLFPPCLYHSFPPCSGLFMLPYILSITLRQITHVTCLCNFKLLINQSAHFLAS